MTANYVLLEKVTLSANAASVTLDNIPQTGYTDLKLVASTRTDRNVGSVSSIYVTINSITTSVYSIKALSGTGSALDSNSTTNGAPTNTLAGHTSQSNNTASTFGSFEFYIPNYAGATAKSASVESVQENRATGAYATINAWLINDTAAITSITLTPTSTFNFVANSTFYLYGIAAVGTTPEIAPFASGGDIVTNDGTYWIHTFLSSGTFTPAKELTCDLLAVAGGAGGGGSDSSGRTAGGGGGAGGYLEQTGRSVAVGSYNVVIGAGGAQGTSAAAATPSLVTRGTNGSNTVFDTSTAIGGGGGSGGGFGLNGTASTGGSGGGGNAAGGTTEAGAAATQGNSGGATGYGFAGGNGGTNGSYQAGAGGGGAGGVGAVGNASASSSGGTAGVGGVGRQSSITGTATYYAAGGSGGNEGSNASNTSTNSIGGAGGRGATSTNPTAGVVNTGSGGGGGSYQGTGGTGGSGIVIIRYPIA
jgi:hypothetical protein